MEESSRNEKGVWIGFRVMKVLLLDMFGDLFNFFFIVIYFNLCSLSGGILFL